LTVVQKTLAEAKAEKGYLDAEKFDGFSDVDIEHSIAEDQDLAPATETLSSLLAVRDVRRKLGLTSRQFAKKLRVSTATLREWESGASRTDPAMQALLRILDSAPESALRALDEPVRKAG
jgi:putative transcriptional regulator